MNTEHFINQARAWLSGVEYMNYNFTVREGHGDIFLQADYFEPDVYSGVDTLQYTRKWLLSPHMTKSEIIQTAFKCCLTSAEHRTREWFLCKGKRIFGPHFDVDDLAALCETRENAGGRA